MGRPAWGDVLFASVLTSPATRTVAVGLQAYIASGESGGPIYWNQLIGASLISSIPIVVLFLIFQRFITGGLTAGALQGGAIRRAAGGGRAPPGPAPHPPPLK